MLKQTLAASQGKIEELNSTIQETERLARAPPTPISGSKVNWKSLLEGINPWRSTDPSSKDSDVPSVENDPLYIHFRLTVSSLLTVY